MPRAKVPKSTCQFCGQEFSSAQIGNHSRWCKAKPAGYTSRTAKYRKKKSPLRRKDFSAAPATLSYCPCCGTNLRNLALALSVLTNGGEA